MSHSMYIQHHVIAVSCGRKRYTSKELTLACLNGGCLSLVGAVSICL